MSDGADQRAGGGEHGYVPNRRSMDVQLERLHKDLIGANLWLGRIEVHLATLNSRVSKSEEAIRALQHAADTALAVAEAVDEARPRWGRIIAGLIAGAAGIGAVVSVVVQLIHSNA